MGFYQQVFTISRSDWAFGCSYPPIQWNILDMYCDLPGYYGLCLYMLLYVVYRFNMI